jgi:hypothetical protein
VNEIFTALDLLRKFTALAIHEQPATDIPDEEWMQKGEAILNDKNQDLHHIPIYAYGFENNQRPTQLMKVPEAYRIYKRLVVYYGICHLLYFIKKHSFDSLKEVLEALPATPQRLQWCNIGSQLIPEPSVQTLINNIHTGAIQGWDEVHDFYKQNSSIYEEQRLQHAFASLLEISGAITPQQLTDSLFKQLLQEALDTREWMVKNIYESRAKDYQNSFRKMMYHSEEEMNQVIGRLEENAFIQQQADELVAFRQSVTYVVNQLHL